MAELCWSSCEEISHAQGKRNPSKTVGVARGHQRADTLKPYICICVYKNFSTMLDKGLRKNIKKEEMEKLENMN